MDDRHLLFIYLLVYVLPLAVILAVVLALIAWWSQRYTDRQHGDARRAQERQRRGHCVKCDYDLTGNTSGICPECGEPVWQ